jgi:hypothetical protein
VAGTRLGSIHQQQPLLLLLLLPLLLPVLKQLTTVVPSPTHVALCWCDKQAVDCLLLLYLLLLLLLYLVLNLLLYLLLYFLKVLRV